MFQLRRISCDSCDHVLDVFYFLSQNIFQEKVEIISFLSPF